MNAASLPPLEIFRAYDIRGVVGESLTEVGVYQIGRAIGTLVRRAGCSEVVVGRDGRLSGPALSDALVRGLAATGCGVIDVGMVPTPVVYFASHAFDTGCGVAVTGSHNPPDYNGLKIVVAGKTLSGDDILGIRALIEADDLETGFGHVREADALTPYRARILGDVKLARRLRVGVDCGNGVAGASAPALIEALGCEVVPLFAQVDGNFPNHHPDPTKPENLQDLIECVRADKLDLGVAFDGDGDRLGVVHRPAGRSRVRRPADDPVRARRALACAGRDHPVRRQVHAPPAARHHRRRRPAADVEDRPLADQGQDGRNRRRPGRRDERAHLLLRSAGTASTTACTPPVGCWST